MSVLAGKRILVVEDEAIIAAMIEDMLTELGATVIGPAATVATGRALAKAGGIDAAVLDVNVGGERIDSLVGELQACAVPVVLATGYGQGAAGIAQGAPILDKPYTSEKLVAALRLVLEKEEA